MSDRLANVKERRLMIVPVGLEVARIIEGFTPYAINILYLITNPENNSEGKTTDKNDEKKKLSPVQKYTLKFAKMIKRKFEDSYLIVEFKYAALNSFYECYNILDEIYKEEIVTNKLKHIFINVSTASKAFALSAYVFALIHFNIVTVFYMKASKYLILEYLEKDVSTKELETEFLKNGLTKGPYIIEEIPTFPILEFSQDEKTLIKILAIQDQFNTIKEIIREFVTETDQSVEWDDLKKEEKNRYRTKVKRLLDNLQRKRHIEYEKKANKINVKVNDSLKYIDQIINR